MRIFKKIADMQAWSEEHRRKGERIGLVPTMGFLHEGHLSLMDQGKKKVDHLVVSIFVNPTQFGANEDLNVYPKNIERDLDLIKKRGAAAVFLPDQKEIYPQGYETHVALNHLPSHLCGLSRPVHFGGVATVVTKLFNIVLPHVAVFGAKDFQQLQVIRRMTEDLNFNIEIVGAPIVRETDGLAMSSRNAYLSHGERASALCLSQALNLAQELIVQGETDAHQIKKAAVALIDSFANTEIDYVVLCDPETLKDVATIRGRVLLALAVQVGKTRLIDNRVMDPSE